MTDLVLGLARHAETERLKPGASPGTKLLFSALERGMSSKCAVRLLPAEFYDSRGAQSAAIAQRLLTDVDALIWSVPPRPLDFAAIGLVRRALGLRVPFVYLPLGEFPRGARFYRYLYRYLTPDDLIWFSSTADRAVYDLLVASSPADVQVIPFGIDPLPFQRAARARSRTRREHGVADDETVFVVHGRISPEKNVHAAVALIAALARAGRRVRLWLVGPAESGAGALPGPQPLSAMPACEYREALISRLGGAGEGLVRWWQGTSRESVARIVAAADVSLNLTLNRDENFGFSTVEAMAAGLPVIGTDWGGLKDTIEDGVTGYHVPTSLTASGAAIDAPVAEQRAIRLTDDVTARRSMGAAAAARVRERYLIGRCTDTVLEQVQRRIGAAHASRQHRWTPLGERLVQRYSIQVGATSEWIPAPLPPPDWPEDAAIAHAILRPYCTN